MRHYAVVILLATALGIATAPVRSDAARLVFEENLGQFTEAVIFLAHGDGFEVGLRDDGFDVLQPTDTGVERIGIRYLWPSAKARALGEGRRARYANYLIGPDPERWVTRAPFFDAVRVDDLADGIAVRYYDNGRGLLEFDFIVQPGAASEIRLRVDGGAIGSGAEPHAFDVMGAEGRLAFGPPVSYQLDALGNRIAVASRYEVVDWRTIAIVFEPALADREVIVDPAVTPSIGRSGYIAGDRSSRGGAAFIGSDGDFIVVGTTEATTLLTDTLSPAPTGTTRTEIISFPSCSDCSDTAPGGSQVLRREVTQPSVMFVTRIDPDTREPEFTTFFGSPERAFIDSPSDGEAVLDAADNLYFALESSPPGLPLANASETSGNGYVAKLRADGTGVDYATYVSAGLLRRGVALGPGNTLYVGGEILPTGFGGPPLTQIDPIDDQVCPTDPAFRRDAFVIRFDATGTIDFASCFGSSGVESLRALAADAIGNLYIVGHTHGSDLPVVNELQSELAVSTTGDPLDIDWYIARINMNEEPPTADFVTYLGGNAHDFPQSVKVDSEGMIWVAGVVRSRDFPTAEPVQPNPLPPATITTDSICLAPSQDIVVSRIDPAAPALLFSTYLGGSGCEARPSLELLSDDSAVLIAPTTSADIPVLGAITPGLAGASDVFLAHYSAEGRYRWGTYLGGSDFDAEGVKPSLDVGPDDTTLLIAASTRSDDFVAGIDPNPDLFDAWYLELELAAAVDSDNDGVADAVDAFPGDASEWADNDGDMVGDNADLDDDNDLANDDVDAFPFDGTETVDTDGDGYGDMIDRFPLDPLEGLDADGDGIGDGSDPDDDNDGTDDLFDAFPLDGTRAVDTDFDGLEDAVDDDDDGDGVLDGQDVDPLDPERPTIGFETFNTFNTARFKRPLPEGFFEVDGADDQWLGATDEARSGFRSLGTPLLDPEATASVALRDLDARSIQFFLKLRTDTTDRFELRADGELIADLGGDVDWQQLAFNFDPPVSELRFSYRKDGTVAGPEADGNDGVWIDDVTVGSDFLSQAIDPPQVLDEGDRYGAAVAIDGSRVAIGVPGDDEAGEDSGAVLVFRREGSALILEQKITAPPGFTTENLGSALSLAGDQLLVGAPADGAATRGDFVAMQAAMFTRLNQTWSLKTPITAQDGSAGDGFGSSVALEGGVIAIGAPDDDDGEAGGGSGAAHVFTFDGDNVLAIDKLKGNPGQPGAGFGSSLAVDNGFVAAGAPGGSIGNAVAGTASLYQLVAGNLAPVGSTLAGSGTGDGAGFGSSLAIEGQTLLVGAPGADDEGAGTLGSGLAYLFSFDPQAAVQRTSFGPTDPVDGGGFGASLAAQANRIAVGAPRGPSGAGQGTVYLFERSGNAVNEVARVESDGQGDDDFARAIDLEEGSVLVGAPETGNSEGEATLLLNVERLFGGDFED